MTGKLIIVSVIVSANMIGGSGAASTFSPEPALAQDTASPLTQAAKAQFGMIKGNLSKTANFSICAAAAGEKAPQTGFEKGKTSKADLSKGLTDSIAYCDSVFAAMDDKKGAETVQFFNRPTPKLAVLFFNIGHCNEHYGNLVTYMRLKGIVPPSSERS
jgi:hypothetical protein